MQEKIQPVFQLAVNGSIDEVEKLLKEGTPINSTDFYGESLLIIATVKKHDELVKRLLAHKDINLHTQGYLTGTALTFAIFSEQWNIAKLLLTEEQHFDNTQHPGAVIWAVYHGHREFLQLLKAKGANFDLTGLNGKEGSPDQDWLWKPFPDPSTTPFHPEYFLHLKHTPLYLALLLEKSDLIKFLLEECKVNSNLPSPDEEGVLPLQLAAEQGNEEIVKLLLKYDADPALMAKHTPKLNENIPSHIRRPRPKIKPNILEILRNNREQKMGQNSFTSTLFRTTPAVIPAKAKGVPEEIIDQLKANAELWKRLTTNPDAWDSIQQIIKNEILKDSPRNNNASVTVV